ncbi:MAG: MFS transporter [Myxococcota bacterium]
MRSRTFWLLALSFAAILFCQVGFLMHQLAFLRERMEPTAAALAISTTAGASMVARLVVGSFADRVRIQRLGVLLFLLQAGTLLGFSRAPDAASLYVASLVLGFSIGNIFMLQSLLVGELFGLSSFGTVFGMLQFTTQVSAGLGPLALGLLFERFGAYAPALLMLVAAELGAALVLSLVPSPAAPAQPEQASCATPGARVETG